MDVRRKIKCYKLICSSRLPYEYIKVPDDYEGWTIVEGWTVCLSRSRIVFSGHYDCYTDCDGYHINQIMADKKATLMKEVKDEVD